jgi:Domain of unknown function (DUF4124)
MAMRKLLSVLMAGLLAAPVPVMAQLYKWLDADGVVNYGDIPPPSAKNVQSVGPASLSVVPGVPKEQMDAMRERDEQRRQEALQRDADEARARASARAASGVPSELQSYEEYAYDYDYGPVFGYGPPRVRRPGANRPRPHPPIARPVPPAKPMPLGEPAILQGR